MKRILTVITLLIPTIAFAQFEPSPSSLLSGIIALLLLALLLLTLREVVMWYWKINTMIDNQTEQLRTQQETNILLSEQITLMKSYYKPNQSTINPTEPID